MHKFWVRRGILAVSIFAVSGLMISSIAVVSPQYVSETDQAIEQVRKNNFSVLVVKGPEKQPLANTQVKVSQVRNQFGFGAAICWDSGFVKIGIDTYGSYIKKYFEWATPENEMKWYYTDMTGGQPCAPGEYSDADSMVDWCLANGINMRGHNLFWNERVEFQAYCARPYGPYDAYDSSRLIQTISAEQQAQFTLEMSNRIHEMVPRYAGKVKHWDAVNEVVHFTTDNSGAREIKVPGLLATWTNKTGNGGAEIFNWVLDTARALDPNVKLCINEYNVIEKAHQQGDYITMIKNINSNAGTNAKIDIIGLEGHFGDLISRTASGNYPGYASLVDEIATGVDINNTNMKFWFTEVDWNSGSPGNTADAMEELMRFSFSRKDFGGLLLWIWWGGRLWRSDLVNFLVDKDFNETETGARWNQMRKKWTTDTTVTTDANGVLKFRGFYGTYTVRDTGAKAELTQEALIDTAWLEPPISVLRTSPSVKKRNILLGNRTVTLSFSDITEPLYLSTYSLSGKLLSRTLIPAVNNVRICPQAAGCHVYRIGTDKKVLFSLMGVNIR
jgi:GH35 family endo-1,4-beta-xylanase